MPEIKATPARSPALLKLAQMLASIDESARKPFGYNNPPMGILSDLTLGNASRAFEKAAYGEPVTGLGKANVPILPDDTVDALFLAAGPLARAGRVVKELPRSVARAAGDFAMAAGQPSSNVIKAKGGNWLTGSVEDALKGLKRPTSDISLADLERGWAEQGLTNSPGAAAIRQDRGSQDAINNWIDKQLTRYVQKEMATPEDPVRALAERGVLHVNPESMPRYMDDVWAAREQAGFPRSEGISPLAQKWEAYADQMVRTKRMDDPIRSGNKGGMTMRDLITSEPGGEWAIKVAGDQPIHELRRPGTSSAAVITDELGFNHLIDELRNATNPESGLPRELLLKYESLPQVSVPQAVERVAKINEWRAAQKAQADLARANNAATVLHKEYPEQGYKWVELTNQKHSIDKLPEGWSLQEFEGAFPGSKIYGVVDSRGHLHPEAAGKQAVTPEIAYENFKKGYGAKELEDALKYEGDTMGHCVGGYCPDVLEGRSRIFSLRDAKGQPHVTIETKPNDYLDYNKWFRSQSEDMQNEIARRRKADPNYDVYSTPEYLNDRASLPPSIIQIKGKANRAPNPEYLPMVQDFVKSGKWSEVGDLSNAGLVEYTKRRQVIPRELTGRTTMGVPFDEVGIPEGYYTENELLDLMRQWQERTGNKPNFASGGLVGGQDLSYNAADIDKMSEQLYSELFPQ